MRAAGVDAWHVHVSRLNDVANKIKMKKKFLCHLSLVSLSLFLFSVDSPPCRLLPVSLCLQRSLLRAAFFLSPSVCNAPSSLTLKLTQLRRHLPVSLCTVVLGDNQCPQLSLTDSLARPPSISNEEAPKSRSLREAKSGKLRRGNERPWLLRDGVGCRLLRRINDSRRWKEKKTAAVCEAMQSMSFSIEGGCGISDLDEKWHR